MNITTSRDSNFNRNLLRHTHVNLPRSGLLRPVTASHKVLCFHSFKEQPTPKKKSKLRAKNENHARQFVTC